MNSNKHHYVPKFYTRQWTGSDGRLCQFSRPHGRVVANRRHPDQIAFEYGLNTIKGAPPEIATYLEDLFFMAVDTHAADALFTLAHGRLEDMDARRRNGWSRFIMSLMHRNPEKIEWFARVWAVKYAEAVADAERELRVRAAKEGKPYEPEPLKHAVEVDRGLSWARVMQSVIDSVELGGTINAMRWAVIELREGFELLTSDRPIIVTNGLKGPDDHIALALNSRKMFIAANSSNKIREIQAIGAVHLAKLNNERVATQAHRYVYGTCDRQHRFVAARLGVKPSQFIAPANMVAEFPRTDWPPT